MTTTAQARPAVAKPFAETAHPLLEKGYSPLRAIGQGCVDKGWTQRAVTPYTAAELEAMARSPLPHNVAIALGFCGVVIVDRDTDDPDVREALRPVFVRIYSRGGIPVAKFGSKGLTTFLRWGEEVFCNRSLTDRDGAVILELSGSGRATILPPSIHPKTGRPYRWATARTLLDTRPDQLPRLFPEDVRAIENALAPFLSPPREPVPIRPTVTVAELGDQDRRRHERYARRILEAECRDLAAMAPDTGRNWRTYQIVCRLGKWVHHGILPATEMTAALVAACETNGLVAEDGRHFVLTTIRSGLARSANDALPDLGGRCQ